MSKTMPSTAVAAKALATQAAAAGDRFRHGLGGRPDGAVDRAGFDRPNAAGRIRASNGSPAAARIRAVPEMTSRLVPCQVSFDGFVVTGFMRSRLQPDPMNRVTTNHQTCHLEFAKALARSESGA